MNSAKNPTCDARRTQTSVRMLFRAGMPEPGSFGSIFEALLRRRLRPVVTLMPSALTHGRWRPSGMTGIDRDGRNRRRAFTVAVVSGSERRFGAGVGTTNGSAVARSIAATAPTFPVFHGIGSTCIGEMERSGRAWWSV